VQEMVPGGDDSLVTAACYLDRLSNWRAGFNTQKLVQAPERFGTGCIVQNVSLPELFEPTMRLLQNMHFTGIAEVEYKWNAATREYQLIEINPRPWDQHRLGKAAGIDLIYLSYCEHAGLAEPGVKEQFSTRKWIAEDTFVLTSLRLLRRRDPKFRTLFRLARGKRMYGIWSVRDPLPFIAFMVARFLPGLFSASLQAAWSAVKAAISGRKSQQEQSLAYEDRLEKGKSHG
jgi:D-aspartate ligase